MDVLFPTTPKEMAETLRENAAAGRLINLGGAFSKARMGGPIANADVTISAAHLTRVLQYEPRDLTISVEAGMRFADLKALLAKDGQMVPLDPPALDSATLGGVLASNGSGPRRRLYGTARDLVIGMRYATVEGKLVQSGGMVVKNVAGLDTGKLLIGSFGTLAAITVVNFKLTPIPAFSRTFLLDFDSLDQAYAERTRILEGVLQPAAIDLLNPAGAAHVGQAPRWLLALEAGGNTGVIGRYKQAFPQARTLEGAVEEEFWHNICDFAPAFLAGHEQGAIVRLSATFTAMPKALKTLDVPTLCRAGNGVAWAAFPQLAQASAWLGQAPRLETTAVIESGPANRENLVQWPGPGPDFAIMEKIKVMFDPDRLLNRGRLYGRL